MWRYVAAIVLATMNMSTTARAEPAINAFLREYDHAPPAAKSIYELAIGNTYNGILWAYTLLHERNERGFYCPPSKVALVNTQLIDMLRREVQEHPENGEMPFGLGLIVAPIKLFPCQ